jgi:hypothetical protein
MANEWENLAAAREALSAAYAKIEAAEAALKAAAEARFAWAAAAEPRGGWPRDEWDVLPIPWPADLCAAEDAARAALEEARASSGYDAAYAAYRAAQVAYESLNAPVYVPARGSSGPYPAYEEFAAP